MNIQFDGKNLLASVVGKGNGLTRPDIERSQTKALKALKSFQKLSEAGRYGFAHLPFQSKTIQEISKSAGTLGSGQSLVGSI